MGIWTAVADSYKEGCRDSNTKTLKKKCDKVSTFNSRNILSSSICSVNQTNWRLQWTIIVKKSPATARGIAVGLLQRMIRISSKVTTFWSRWLLRHRWAASGATVAWYLVFPTMAIIWSDPPSITLSFEVLVASPIRVHATIGWWNWKMVEDTFKTPQGRQQSQPRQQK